MNIATRMIGFFGNLKPEKLFLTLAITFGFASLMLVPVLTVPDEGIHFWISYKTFSKLNHVADDLLISPEQILKKLDRKSYFNDIYVKKVNFENSKLMFEDRKISVAQAPQSIGVLIGKYLYASVGSMILFGRLINMATFIFIIYFVIKYTRKWKLVILCIALFPMTIQQMASLSYDSINFAVIVSWAVLILNVAYNKVKVTKKVLLLSLLIAVLLCLTKPINILLLILYPIILYRKYSGITNGKINNALLLVKGFAERKKKYLVGLLAAAVLVLVLVTSISRYGTALKTLKIIINTFFRPEVNTQLDPIVFSGIVGNFGWLYYRLPAWIVFINLLVLCFVLLKDNVKSIKRYKYINYIFTATFLAYIAGIFAAMYLLWTRLDFVAGADAIFIQGVQGRYITPVLILLIPLFSFIYGFVDIKLSYKHTQILLSMVTVFTLSTYLFLTYVFYYTSAYGIKNPLILR